MSSSGDEPTESAFDSVVNWDNVTQVFAYMTEQVDRVAPRPEAVQNRDLPNDDDIGDMESRLADLSYATTDAEKVAALKSMTLWLAQWKF